MADSNDSTPAGATEGTSGGSTADGAAQATVHTLGLGPALAAVNGYLGQAQAQTVLFANMVNQQAQLAMMAQATLSQGLATLYSGGTQAEPASGPAANKTGEEAR